MMVDVITMYGTQKVRVCDYCKTVCIPSGRFCSGRCAREYLESRDRIESSRNPQPKEDE